MKKITLLVVLLLFAVTASAKWPPVNSTVPGTDGQCLINSSGNVGAADCGSGGGGAPTTATYITQTANGSLSAEQALGSLATGLMKSATTTGVVSTLAPTDDNVVVGSGTDWELKAIPNCTDTGGNHLNYTAATNAFSCGTSGGGGSQTPWAQDIDGGGFDLSNVASITVAGVGAGVLELGNASNAFTTGFQGGVPSGGANLIWTMPTADGTVNQCLKTDGSKVLGWANCSSGTTGDLVATLTAAETAVTTTATLVFSTLTVAASTTTNYTVTLPVCAANGDKLLGIRVTPASTFLVTVDGNGAETIDGAANRIMWAGESAILKCNGTEWNKIAGKSIPMEASMHLSATTASSFFTSGAATKVLVNTVDTDNTGQMGDSANTRINIVRPGRYHVRGLTAYSNMSGNASRIQTRVNKNGSLLRNNEASTLSGSFHALDLNFEVLLAAADTIELAGFQNSGAAQEAFGGAGAAGTCSISALEVITW